MLVKKIFINQRGVKTIKIMFNWKKVKNNLWAKFFIIFNHSLFASLNLPFNFDMPTSFLLVELFYGKHE